MKTDNQVEQKLAGSLTAETTELLPYLPYLLQDIWELGSSPQDMLRLIKGNIDSTNGMKIIDLACGKGAVSIFLCKELGVRVYGYDLIPEFIEEAKAKADEHGVRQLCDFTVQDINELVKTEGGYDIAILGAVGDVLGNPAETLNKLKNMVRSKGYILIDDAYLAGQQSDVQYQNYEYLPLEQWKELFLKLELELTESLSYEDSKLQDTVNDYNNRMIKKRADELSKKYPDKQEIFEGYVKSQLMECDDLGGTIIGVTWLLRRLS